MDEWRKAAKLLGSDSSNEEYAATERNLLRDEMNRQGMTTKGSQAVLNCLAQYNNTGIRCGLVGGLTEVTNGI